MYYKYPISDVHIHAFHTADANNTIKMVEELGYEHFVMLSTCSIDPEAIGNNLLCAYTKLASKGKGYAFAAVHYPEIGVPTAEDMLSQVKLYHELGFDGIKMMDGKPAMRKLIGVPLDDPCFDPMFSFMEEMDIPLLYHVNDPDEFWTWELMPEWAKADGDRLFYGRGDYPTKQEIENEAVRILDKHPKLRVIFPHFFFTSTNYDRTKYLLDTYPNLLYDITPGWEMFESFAQDYDRWRQFFIDYSHKILFGTDTISPHWRDTVGSLRRVMETDEEFVAFEENCKGLKLDGESLENIYKNNFDKYLPNAPRNMDVNGLLNYAKTLEKRWEALVHCNKNLAKQSVLDAVKLIHEL